MKQLLKGEKRKIAIVAATIIFAAILFYELLEHFTPVKNVISVFLKVVAPILYGVCFAFVVNLPMSFFENTVFKKLKAKRPKLVRGLSVVISYLLVLGFIALIISLVLPKVIGSVLIVVSNFDEYLRIITDFVNSKTDSLYLTPEAYAFLQKIYDRIMDKINAFALDTVPKIPKMTMSVVTFLYSILVTLVISIHSLIKKEKLQDFARRTVTAIFKKERSDYIFHYASFANTTFKKYITGQLTSCIIIGIFCYIGMRVFKMPYPELISVFICVAALFPIIGPWASTIPSAFIILMTRQDNPWLALWFLVMIVAIQALDDNLVYPRIVGDAVGIPGMLVLAAIIVGGGLFGIGGLLVAVPTAAVIYRIFRDWVNKRNKEKAEREAEEKEAFVQPE